MKAETRLAAILVAGTLMAAHLPPAFAQGVPVIDGSNLAQNIEQLQAALRDAENQLQQIEELRTQIERLTVIQGLLDDVLGSITGLNEIAALYNDVEDLRARAQKITDLSGFMDSLSLGNFDSLLDDLLDGDVTMGERRAADAMRETMASAGFTSEKLTELNDAGNPQGAAIADLAAANAMVIGQAQISYEEAAQSIERIDGLVGSDWRTGNAQGIDRSQHAYGRGDELHAGPDVAPECRPRLGARSKWHRFRGRAGPHPLLL